MEGFPSDFQAVQAASDKALETLHTVVAWLHQEGFYNAEHALLGEVESRYPDHLQPCANSPAVPHVSPHPKDTSVNLNASAGSAELPGPGDVPSSAERVLEAWRSKSTTPVASPRQDSGNTAPLPLSSSPPPPPFLPSSFFPPAAASPASGGSGRQSPSQSIGIDEYDDDDDVGYWKIPATSQELYTFGDPQQSPFSAEATAPYERAPFSLPKSPSTASLPYSHSRHSSFELPLQLEPPVVGDHLRGSGNQLPPLPGSARSTRSAGPAVGAAPSPSSQAVQRSTSGGGNGGGGMNVSNSNSNSSAADWNRMESVDRRHAGTARWVFDRQNSASSEAYKSLLTFLDQQSPRTQPLPLASADASDGGTTTGPSPRTPTAAAAAAAAGEAPGGDGGIITACSSPERAIVSTAAAVIDDQQQQEQPWEEPSAAELVVDEQEQQHRVYNVYDVGTVASLSESVMVEALKKNESTDGGGGGGGAVDAMQSRLIPPPRTEEETVYSIDSGDDDEEDRHKEEELKEEAAALQGLPCLKISAPINHTQQATTTTTTALTPTFLTPAPAATFSPAPVAVSTPVHNDTDTNGNYTETDLLFPAAAAAESKARRHSSSSGMLDSTAANMDGCSSTAAVNMGHQSDRGDPFSFPVTSPSEHGGGGGERGAPGPFFGTSWPSFKNLGSPAHSAGGSYCSAEEEMTPGARARRGHRIRLSTASSSGNLGLPPAGPGLALKFPQHVRRSSSQQGLALAASTPFAGGQYGDLALYEYDEDAFEEKYDVFDLRVIHRRGGTGFEPTRELPLRINDLIGGRYQIVDLLGQAAFCRAVQALDLKTGSLVCLKVVKNNKDYFDQSLDEIKILQYVNAADPDDGYSILRLYDFFYFKEHLILVTELLRANLYEFMKHNKDSGAPPYFTLPRIQSIARQVLRSLAFLHSLGLVHADLKPENILMKSYSNCEVKVIDLGSSCFLTDRLSSYVQSRSYRAPEVILGWPYGYKIDVWSLGCIIAELATGKVLFHNAAPSVILARIEGILGPVPQHMLSRGRYASRYYTADGKLYERNKESGVVEFLKPKRTSLGKRVPQADAGMLDFISALLQVDPARRPSAIEAMQHPWLQQKY